MPLLAYRRRRLHGKECEQSLGAERSPGLMANKEMGTSELQLQGTEFCQEE